MKESALKILHEDHKAWLSEIKFYMEEISFLKRILVSTSKSNTEDDPEKVEKYINHLDHNLRFLKETKETIDTHELFMKDSFPKFQEENLLFTDDQEYVDHEKSKKHIKEFRQRYNKLKIKIFRIID
jgi:hypothetical protein